MPSAIAVLDTNVYRSLSDDRFETLMRLERDQSVVSMCAKGVVLELMARLSDAESPEFISAWRALKRLARHCSRFDGSKYVLMMVSPIEDQLMAWLGHASVHKLDEKNKVLGQIVGAVLDSQTPEDTAELHPFFAHARDVGDRRKSVFRTGIHDGLVRHAVPGANSWDAIERNTAAQRAALEYIDAGRLRMNAAEGIVDGVLEDFAVHVSETVREQLVEVVQADFPVPLEIFSRLIREVVTKGVSVEKKKRDNTVWDLDIASAVSPTLLMAGVPTLLVTDDAGTLRAAGAIGYGGTVLSLDAYMARLTSRSFLT